MLRKLKMKQKFLKFAGGDKTIIKKTFKNFLTFLRCPPTIVSERFATLKLKKKKTTMSISWQNNL